MSLQSNIAERMRAIAETLGRSQLTWKKTGKLLTVELREKADALDAAVKAATSPGAGATEAKKMLGAWARARAVYNYVADLPV